MILNYVMLIIMVILRVAFFDFDKVGNNCRMESENNICVDAITIRNLI